MRTTIEIQSVPVSKLFRWFDRRSLAIPEVQREFVWNANRACALLDSIFQGYPVGTVMIWKTGRQRQSMLRQTLHVLPTFDPAQNKEILFLLDGQQRLSVLHNVRMGTTVSNESGREIRFGDIFFSLDGEETGNHFVYLRRHDPEIHFRATDILRGVCRPDGVKRTKAIQGCRDRILTYRLPVVFSRTNEVEHVRETFIRINSQGMRIRESEKAFSQAQKVGALHLFHQLKASMSPGYAGISKDVYWNTLALARGYRSLGQKSTSRLSKDIEKTEKGEKWFKAEEQPIAIAIRKACDYLQNVFGATSLAFLPSENMIAVLALFFRANGGQPSATQARQIRTWFWHVATAQRYSGANLDRHITEDVDFFTKLGETHRGKFHIRQRTPIYKLRLGTYNASSALAKAYRLLLMHSAPCYLENGEPIPLDQVSASENKKQLHHIIPRAVLNGLDVPDEQQNLICNICYLVANENQSFGGHAPSLYLRDFRKKKHFAATMRSHLIPHGSDSPLWDKPSKASFKRFLDARAAVLAGAFARVAGTKLFE